MPRKKREGGQEVTQETAGMAPAEVITTLRQFPHEMVHWHSAFYGTAANQLPRPWFVERGSGGRDKFGDDGRRRHGMEWMQASRVEWHILSRIGQPEVLRTWIDWRKGAWDKIWGMDFGLRLRGMH